MQKDPRQMSDEELQRAVTKVYEKKLDEQSVLDIPLETKTAFFYNSANNEFGVVDYALFEKHPWLNPKGTACVFVGMAGVMSTFHIPTFKMVIAAKENRRSADIEWYDLQVSSRRHFPIGTFLFERVEQETYANVPCPLEVYRTFQRQIGPYDPDFTWSLKYLQVPQEVMEILQEDRKRVRRRQEKQLNDKITKEIESEKYKIFSPEEAMMDGFTKVTPFRGQTPSQAHEQMKGIDKEIFGKCIVVDTYGYPSLFYQQFTEGDVFFPKRFSIWTR